MRPIDRTTYPFTFTYDGETYKHLDADSFVKMIDGHEHPITKKSNELMDALMGGEIVDADEKTEKNVEDSKKDTTEDKAGD
jgi:hypothetical protein